MAQYQVWVEDDSYNKVAFVRYFARLEYTQALNDVGYATLEMHPEDDKISELLLGRRLKIIRDGEIVFGGRLLREGWKKPTTAPAGETWAVTALDHADYARARIAVPASGQEYQTYTDHADDVAKKFVYYNLGAGADAARQFSDVSVEADEHAAASLTYNARYTIILSVLQELADAGGFAWRFVPTASGCEFRTALNWGLDRTKGNGVNDEFVMSADRRTFAEMGYARDATALANYVYVGGQGEGANRTVVERSDSGSISTWKRREAFVDARQLSLTASLQARGDAELAARGVEIAIVGEPIFDSWKRATPPTWDLGDIITIYARQWGREFSANAKITRLTVTVSADGLETVKPVLEVIS